jgi:hypothetical protein
VRREQRDHDAEVGGVEDVAAVPAQRELARDRDRAASIASARWFVRSSRHSDRPEISALRGSNAGRRAARVQIHWVASAASNVAIA